MNLFLELSFEVRQVRLLASATRLALAEPARLGVGGRCTRVASCWRQLRPYMLLSDMFEFQGHWTCLPG